MHIIITSINKQIVISMNTIGNASTTISDICVLVANVVVVVYAEYKQKHRQTSMTLSQKLSNVKDTSRIKQNALS